MEPKKPIKRDKVLQPLSHDHHQGLLLCWKIRTGIKKGIELERIKTYTDWFYKTHLVPHFKTEEAWIFPILGNEHELVKKALTEHRRIKRLCETTDDQKRNLSLLEEELESHIRFEERILFNEIQTAASAEDLLMLTEKHIESEFLENTDDQFWK
jgi:hypothetical protein